MSVVLAHSPEHVGALASCASWPSSAAPFVAPSHASVVVAKRTIAGARYLTAAILAPTDTPACRPRKPDRLGLRLEDPGELVEHVGELPFPVSALPEHGGCPLVSHGTRAYTESMGADASQHPHTAWILGAGFSKSLGGPLLNQLMSPSMNAHVSAVYMTNEKIPCGRGVHDEYNHHPVNKERRAGSVVRTLFERGLEKGYWPDAEAFLDQLDAAHHVKEGSPSFRRMVSVLAQLVPELNEDNRVPPTIEELRDAARRLVAAACCVFVHEPDTQEERWSPYLRWAAALGTSDTVITFNYDRVLETLGGKVCVVDPSTHEITSEDAAVFKLHGSVDWMRLEAPNQPPFSIPKGNLADPEYALTCAGFQIGIATPGNTKRLAVGKLKPLWRAACDRLRRASVIVFVGYRFPPSDAEARKTLIETLVENTSRHVELHVVLGPSRSDDVVRLEQLLAYAMRRTGRENWRPTFEGIKEHLNDPNFLEPLPRPKTYQVTTHALYAEDFFTVWDRGVLWEPGIQTVAGA
jgi:hypothetical protein